MFSLKAKDFYFSQPLGKVSDDFFSYSCHVCFRFYSHLLAVLIIRCFDAFSVNIVTKSMEG